jgi:hypothetical protein
VICGDAYTASESYGLDEFLGGLLEMKCRQPVRWVGNEPSRGIQVDVRVIEVRDNDPRILV